MVIEPGGLCPLSHGCIQWALSHGSCLVGCVLWAMSCGSWTVSSGPCPVGCSLWTQWTVSCGFYPMGRVLWACSMGHVGWVVLYVACPCAATVQVHGPPTLSLHRLPPQQWDQVLTLPGTPARPQQLLHSFPCPLASVDSSVDSSTDSSVARRGPANKVGAYRGWTSCQGAGSHPRFLCWVMFCDRSHGQLGTEDSRGAVSVGVLEHGPGLPCAPGSVVLASSALPDTVTVLARGGRVHPTPDRVAPPPHRHSSPQPHAPAFGQSRCSCHEPALRTHSILSPLLRHPCGAPPLRNALTSFGLPEPRPQDPHLSWPRGRSSPGTPGSSGRAPVWKAHPFCRWMALPSHSPSRMLLSPLCAAVTTVLFRSTSRPVTQPRWEPWGSACR